MTRSSAEFISIGSRLKVFLTRFAVGCVREYRVVFITLWPLLSLLHFRNRRLLPSELLHPITHSNLSFRCKFDTFPEFGLFARQKIVICFDARRLWQPWWGSGTARYVPACVASRSGAFFAAPECGNAAAGGAAEIATRQTSAQHNASPSLCFNTRCAHTSHTMTFQND